MWSDFSEKKILISCDKQLKRNKKNKESKINKAETLKKKNAKILWRFSIKSSFVEEFQKK